MIATDINENVLIFNDYVVYKHEYAGEDIDENYEKFTGFGNFIRIDGDKQREACWLRIYNKKMGTFIKHRLNVKKIDKRRSHVENVGELMDYYFDKNGNEINIGDLIYYYAYDSEYVMKKKIGKIVDLTKFGKVYFGICDLYGDSNKYSGSGERNIYEVVKVPIIDQTMMILEKYTI
jgi:hypothetical protein